MSAYQWRPSDGGCDLYGSREAAPVADMEEAARPAQMAPPRGLSARLAAADDEFRDTTDMRIRSQQRPLYCRGDVDGNPQTTTTTRRRSIATKTSQCASALSDWSTTNNGIRLNCGATRAANEVIGVGSQSNNSNHNNSISKRRERRKRRLAPNQQRPEEEEEDEATFRLISDKQQQVDANSWLLSSPKYQQQQQRSLSISSDYYSLAASSSANSTPNKTQETTTTTTTTTTAQPTVHTRHHTNRRTSSTSNTIIYENPAYLSIGAKQLLDYNTSQQDTRKDMNSSQVDPPTSRLATSAGPHPRMGCQPDGEADEQPKKQSKQLKEALERSTYRPANASARQTSGRRQPQLDVSGGDGANIDSDYVTLAGGAKLVGDKDKEESYSGGIDMDGVKHRDSLSSSSSLLSSSATTTSSGAATNNSSSSMMAPFGVHRSADRAAGGGVGGKQTGVQMTTTTNNPGEKRTNNKKRTTKRLADDEQRQQQSDESKSSQSKSTSANKRNNSIRPSPPPQPKTTTTTTTTTTGRTSTGLLAASAVDYHQHNKDQQNQLNSIKFQQNKLNYLLGQDDNNNDNDDDNSFVAGRHQQRFKSNQSQHQQQIEFPTSTRRPQLSGSSATTTTATTPQTNNNNLESNYYYYATPASAVDMPNNNSAGHYHLNHQRHPNQMNTGQQQSRASWLSTAGRPPAAAPKDSKTRVDQSDKLEPLIRSTSCQNKTLIDLRNGQPHQNHYLESTLISGGNLRPIELAHMKQLDDVDPDQHLYCSLTNQQQPPQQPIYLQPNNQHYYYHQNQPQPQQQPHLMMDHSLLYYRQQQQPTTTGAFNLSSSSGHQLLSTGASSSTNTDNSVLDNQLSSFKCHYAARLGAPIPSGGTNNKQPKSGRHKPAWLLRMLILTASVLLIGLSVVFYMQTSGVDSSGQTTSLRDERRQINSFEDPKGQPNYRYFQYFNQTALREAATATAAGAPPGGVRLPPTTVIMATVAPINERGGQHKWTAAAAADDDHFLASNLSAQVSTSTTTTQRAPTDEDDDYQQQLDEAFSRSYWPLPGRDNHSEEQQFHCLSSSGQCNSNHHNNHHHHNDHNDNLNGGPAGRCDPLSGLCVCSRGFSGPNCELANCPNHCSHRGECRLKKPSSSPLASPSPSAAFQSVAFAAQTLSKARLSSCGPSRDDYQHQVASTTYFDHRTEWACECQLGFAGPDCSQLMELNCQDELDDDLDGLVDCEDDDCCRSSQTCRDNLMCFKSPEPIRVLEDEATTTGNNNNSSLAAELLLVSDDQDNEQRLKSVRFLAQWRFLIANGSVQSYAQERAFDPSRLAIIRGRVTRQQRPGEGIVSVRVSVLESAAFGFTLSRSDGHFDLLVNGHDWLTLQFHRNAYRPTRRKLFVRAHSINVLDSDMELRLVNDEPRHHLDQADIGQSPPSQLPYGLHHALDLFKRSADTAKQQAQQSPPVECLLDQLLGPSRRASSQFHSIHRPLLVIDSAAPDNDNDHQSSSATDHWRTFALASQPASSFSTKLNLIDEDQSKPVGLLYNSANFAPSSSVAKPIVGLQLLATNFRPISPDFKLTKVHLRLDIEGQSRSESLEPIPSLSYQFAWNRRNVYEQKIYGFGELNIRVGYEYSFIGSSTDQSPQTRRNCPQPPVVWNNSTITASRKQVVWFEKRLFMEAHPMNQHSDLGKWTLSESDRYDSQRELVYFAANWQLPFGLAYPPTVSGRRPLVDELPSVGDQFDQVEQEPEDELAATGPARLLARGPDSTMFVALLDSNRLLQLDSTGNKRLINVPLSMLTSKFGQQTSAGREMSGPSTSGGMRRRHTITTNQEDLQILFNNFDSSLYLSSRTAGKLVQVSLASLNVLNKTLAGNSATLAPEDEIELDVVCGFGSRPEAAASHLRPCKSARLAGPHSMTLDEANQILYFVDGPNSIMALDLASNLLVNLLEAAAFRAQVGANNRPPLEDDQCQLRPIEDASYLMQKGRRIHSLAWIRADSSLYFVHQHNNAIYALRQDLSIELIARGQSPTASLARCPELADTEWTRSRLGAIKSLAVDESTNGNELVVLHEARFNNDNKTEKANHLDGRRGGRPTRGFFLAKISTGIGVKSGKGKHGAPPVVVDLHSSESAWNPLIRRLAGARKVAHQINWPELASTGSSSSTQRGIPFINLLTNGFGRADCIEINSAGSIFVLDSIDQSVRLVETYSPSRFNRLQRNGVHLNRLFALSKDQQKTSGGGGGQSLSVIEVRNPITLKLMEFHWPSGLLLRSLRTRRRQQQQHKQNDDINQANNNNNNTTSRELQFYYKILTNDQGQQEQGNYNDNKLAKTFSLDEDDRNDLETQKLILKFIGSQENGNKQFNDGDDADDGDGDRRQQENTDNNNNQKSLSQLNSLASNSVIRLAGFLEREVSDLESGDTKRLGLQQQYERQFQLIRSYSNSRFAIQSVLMNDRPICNINVDQTGVMSSFEAISSSKGQLDRTNNNLTEFVYHPTTYLLENVITKRRLQQPISRISHNRQQQQQPQTISIITKRIVYDKIFSHYCDLLVS